MSEIISNDEGYVKQNTVNQFIIHRIESAHKAWLLTSHTKYIYTVNQPITYQTESGHKVLSQTPRILSHCSGETPSEPHPGRQRLEHWGSSCHKSLSRSSSRLISYCRIKRIKKNE